MWKRIKFWTVTVILLALSAACAYLYFSGRRKAMVRQVVDAPAVVRQIQQLNELVTVKYSIQKVVGLEEEKVPFGSEKILLMVQANVLGGIDLSTISPQDCVVVAGKSVTLRLPPPKVLQVFINEKETQVWDRSKTWWTPWVPFNPELERKARLAALEAQQNAEKTICEFLNAAGITTVHFETAQAESSGTGQ